MLNIFILLLILYQNYIQHGIIYITSYTVCIIINNSLQFILKFA